MIKDINVTLNWQGKDNILIKLDDNNNPVWGSYGDIPHLQLQERFSYGEIPKNNDTRNENIFIKGDNLHSLNILKEYFKGKIKLIYIDPPFNTGKIFDHYADGLPQNLWLSMMKIRLELMKELLSDDGSIMVHIDDDEMPYLKVLMDEILLNERKNFGNRSSKSNHVTTIVWQKKTSPQNDSKYFSDVHDFILVYAKDIEKYKVNLLERSEIQNSRYTNRDNDSRGIWTSSDLTVKTPNQEWIYPITLPSGRIVHPAKSRSWGISKDRFNELLLDNRIWFGNNGDSMPRLKRFLHEVKNGVVPKTIWFKDEVGDNSEGKREVKRFTSENFNVFTTPKPERLLKRIIQVATNEGDMVLDAFLGSGTTCAVAHKLNRKWIGLENGCQLEEICIPRLKQVVLGEDKGGISKDLKWKGGGGFKVFDMID